ncbi:glycosyltransferase family 2 protein [Bradyrhizobium sp. 25ACV]
MNIAVGFATTGRRDLLSETLRRVAAQTRRPELVVICHVKADDVDREVIANLPLRIAVIQSSPGLTVQRNRILHELKGFSVAVFFDDDFFPAADYLEGVEHIFVQIENAAIVTGQVIADGANGPGILPEHADEILRASEAMIDPTAAPEIVFSAYGCNMAIRLEVAIANCLEFDEELPLYGWLEDMSFSRQMARYGDVLWVPQLRGVHLSIKSARSSGFSFGYAQIANPIHLWRKGLISWTVVLSHAGKNFVANVLRLSRADTYVDRKGRLAGNLSALKDLALGRINPGRILGLSKST